MADISVFLQKIVDAVYGEDVRWSIHDAIALINSVSEVVISAGTAVTSASSSSTGFYKDSLYLNTNTWDLWKCLGTDTWTKLGNLHGVGVDSITKTATVGLVDTYTILYTDGTSTTFNVINGNGISSITGPVSSGSQPVIDTYTIHYTNGTTQEYIVTNGKDGNMWYRGIQISGKNPAAQIYPTGIPMAHVNDRYLNPQEGAIYYCVTEGNASTATWAYDFTMSGGGGGVADLNDLSDVDITNPSDGQIMTYNATAQEWENKDPDKSFVRYGGALNFADLATYASTYLDAAYEDVFFLMRTSGTIGTGEASQYWTSNFSDGDVIPEDAHIAVININRGTNNPPVYRYDDFGGFVDISDKADKSELDEFTEAAYANAQYEVAFDNLDPNYGYELFCDGIIINWKSVLQSSGTEQGTIKLTYTVNSSGTDPLNGNAKSVITGNNGTPWHLRILK